MNAATTLQPEIGQLDLTSATKALARLLRLLPEFSVHDTRSPQRVELETYVGQQFERAYAAQINAFLPQLISMRCQDRISAVAGVRHAADGELFAEQYIDDPIEKVTSRLSPVDVERGDIVEIGNLSGTHRGATLLFFVILSASLHQAGVKWTVFAATKQVEKTTRKLGFVSANLGAARADRLNADASQWGRYYDTQPTVVATDVAATVAKLRRSPLPAAVLAYFDTTICELGQAIRAQTSQ
jgi:hypothetical protein